MSHATAALLRRMILAVWRGEKGVSSDLKERLGVGIGSMMSNEAAGLNARGVRQKGGSARGSAHRALKRRKL